MTKQSITPVPFTPDRLLEATGGVLVCKKEGAVFSSVSIDSRDINPGSLFVAVKGDNHDGHSFVNQVIASGVKGIIIRQDRQNDFPISDWENDGITCLAVSDTIQALGLMARAQRLETGVKLIAVTGSNGKTSTRAMTASILGKRFCTHATEGNYNNEIGLPLTLLKLGYEHEWAVVELGMNAPGEIKRLGDIARPDVGIITNIGSAHLEGLETIENIARAKGELLPTVNENGAVILNAQLPLMDELTQGLKPTTWFFGDSETSLIQADGISIENGNVTFRLSMDDSETQITLKTPGPFMVVNALAAATAGMVAGLDIKTIKEGLESFSPVKGRINVLRSTKGYHLIDDTYNANPDSMMAAISTLKTIKNAHRGFFVMGDMLELGKETDTLHKQIGAYAADAGIEEIYATGQHAHLVSEGAKKRGMKPDYIFTGSKKEIINSLLTKLVEDDWVLVKGSRSMAMEEIVESLL